MKFSSGFRFSRRGVAMAAIAMGAAVLSVATGGSQLAAQRLERRAERGARDTGSAQAPGAPAMERQFRERLAEVVRRRLNLDETQMRRLRDVNERTERERVSLLRRERQVRTALRTEVLAGDSADQAKVGRLLDEAMQIQRRRLDVTSREQQELAAFMTPVQRAKYFGIQDDLRRRLEELREQRQRQQRRPGGAPPQP